MKTDYSDGLIIDVPEKLSKLRRAAETSATVMAAIVWLVAVRPLLAIGLWYVGWHLAYTHMIRLQGFNNLGYFALLGMIALSLFSSMFLWSRYNAARFRGKTRRGSRLATSATEMANFFAISTGELDRLRGAREVVVNRSERIRVVFTCGEGEPIVAEHEPMGQPTALWSPLCDPAVARARRALPLAAADDRE